MMGLHSGSPPTPPPPSPKLGGLLGSLPPKHDEGSPPPPGPCLGVMFTEPGRPADCPNGPGLPGPLLPDTGPPPRKVPLRAVRPHALPPRPAAPPGPGAPENPPAPAEPPCPAGPPATEVFGWSPLNGYVPVIVPP